MPLPANPLNGKHPALPRRPAAGFTLIEIMVVIAIIGLILTFVAPNVWNKLREAKVTTTKAKMTQLKANIEDYRRHNNRVPDGLDDLLQPSEKNLNEPYVDDESKLLDAWDNPFQYQKLSNTKYDIISLGADGAEGGEADEADIHSLPEASQR